MVRGAILSGINWALGQGCEIISMSLGSQNRPSQLYESVGQRALNQGSLIIAAAGNESCRNPALEPNSQICRYNPGLISPVGSPANARSIMSVGALNRYLQIGNFSNRNTSYIGGEIDIAAPGVDVFSSYPTTKENYAYLSGPSMATPHVAGIAAYGFKLLVKKEPLCGVF